MRKQADVVGELIFQLTKIPPAAHIAFACVRVWTEVVSIALISMSVFVACAHEYRFVPTKITKMTEANKQQKKKHETNSQ